MAPYQLLWRKWNLPQPKAAHSCRKWGYSFSYHWSVGHRSVHKGWWNMRALLQVPASSSIEENYNIPACPSVWLSIRKSLCYQFTDWSWKYNFFMKDEQRSWENQWEDRAATQKKVANEVRQMFLEKSSNPQCKSKFLQMGTVDALVHRGVQIILYRLFPQFVYKH